MLQLGGGIGSPLPRGAESKAARNGRILPVNATADTSAHTVIDATLTDASVWEEEDVRTPGVDPQLRQELDSVVSSICRALNDPKRLVVLYALRDGPHTVTELCQALGVPQANTSQHLAVLRERGLVATERMGNKVLYSLRHRKVVDAVDMLRDVMADELERQQLALSPRRAR